MKDRHPLADRGGGAEQHGPSLRRFGMLAQANGQIFGLLLADRIMRQPDQPAGPVGKAAPPRNQSGQIRRQRRTGKGRYRDPPHPLRGIVEETQIPYIAPQGQAFIPAQFPALPGGERGERRGAFGQCRGVSL